MLFIAVSDSVNYLVGKICWKCRFLCESRCVRHRSL